MAGDASLDRWDRVSAVDRYDDTVDEGTGGDEEADRFGDVRNPSEPDVQAACAPALC
jgi:hypothetical protein